MPDSPATLLYRLQTVDQAVMQRRVRIKAINAAIGQNEAVNQAQKQVTTATDALKPWQVRTRDLDLQIKQVSEKIKTTEDNLYSGRINDPKVMRDTQSEIEALKRSHAKLEDQLLEAMMHSEEAETVLNAAQKTLNDAQALHASSQIDLVAEKERLESELEPLAERRKDAAALIDAESLALYESLRPKKSGSPVALLKQGSCMSCQVEQTSSLVQKVMQDKTLVTCAACGRILASRG